ncbi:NAD(P)H-dependent flavin oxidoreductase [Pontivivens ytuae]|uniref:NAD(P)H-dependent flavin oxidoreductase n=1 Tax=Pontivivens ytuae TaxID=2789856 RepID=UPI001E655F93|nr:nitronate monooxygenase [Pontivivens ytuae]
MTGLNTRLTERYGVRHPFTQAGMAFAGEKPDLALAVGRGGGIGAIGVGFTPPAVLREHIARLRDADAPYNINFITCFGNEEQVRATAEERVPIVSFHWGLPPDDQVKRLKDSGADIWVQVGTIEDGERAVALGADVIVAQGWEAGGHNYGGMGSMALIPAMVDAVGDRAMVLGSGGITDGRGVAAALALGADGVWVGTRLVAAKEAWVHPEHHRRLVAATGSDTTRSGVFGPEMPDFNPMRLMRVRPTEEFEGRLEDVPVERSEEPVIGHTTFLGQPHEKRRFDVILPTPDTTGDFEEMAWLMGQGVGLVHDIRPAADIVEQMMADAAHILGRTPAPVAAQ